LDKVGVKVRTNDGRQAFILVALLLAALAEGLGQDGKKVRSQAAAQHSPTTYYVDSITGGDHNSGTSADYAWKTLTRVNETRFLPGDKILFKSGSVWQGHFSPKGSGTEQRPILVNKYGGDVQPIISGGGDAEDAVLLKNQEYWEISNLEITNTDTASGVRRGVRLVAENFGDMHHIYLRGLIVHDVNGTDKMKENGGITYNCAGDSKPSRFVDLRIENNHIHHVDRSGIFGWSTHWVRSKWYPSLGVVIRNNVLDDIGGDGIVPVATDGALVEYNVVGHANQRSAGYNVAIWPWSADNTIIQYNEAYGTHGQRDGEGFDSDWNSRGTVIQYNYSHDNDGGFLLICNEGGHPQAESVGNTGTIVRYNISQNDHHRGINVAGPVTNSTIYNNTIYVDKDSQVDLVLFSDWKGWADGTYFYNNIFYVQGAGQFSHGLSRSSDGAYATASGTGNSRDNRFDFNVYYGNMNPPDDSHIITADPLLFSTGTAGNGRESAGGYRLRPGSPAIDSGKVIERNGAHDFFGNAVPSCRGVDRGAMESDACVSSQR
jgi:hypothetical protein